MKTFEAITAESEMSDLILVLSRAAEYESVVLVRRRLHFARSPHLQRHNDKGHLNKLNRSVRFPIKGKFKVSEEKRYCVLQVRSLFPLSTHFPGWDRWSQVRGVLDEPGIP